MRNYKCKGYVSGSRHHFAKLNEESVSRIKHRLLDGESKSVLAKEFLVSHSLIMEIARQKAWKNIGPTLPSNIVGHRDNRKNPWAKLDEVTVGYIKWHLNVGVAHCLLAIYFKVSVDTIGRIAREITWKNVKPKESPHRIHAPERKLPIRLRGDRLKEKIKETQHAV